MICQYILKDGSCNINNCRKHDKNNIIRNKINKNIQSDKQSQRKINSDKYVTINWILQKLEDQKCFYCKRNIEIQIYKCAKQFSIDRINNDVAHHIDNCVISCLGCNILKGDNVSFEYFVKSFNKKKVNNWKNQMLMIAKEDGIDDYGEFEKKLDDCLSTLELMAVCKKFFGYQGNNRKGSFYKVRYIFYGKDDNPHKNYDFYRDPIYDQSRYCRIPMCNPRHVKNIRNEITTKKQLEKYPIGSLISYENTKGDFKLGGYIIEFHDTYFVYVYLDFVVTHVGRYSRIKKMWVASVCRFNVKTSQDKTLYPHKSGDVVVYYATDSINLSNSERIMSGWTKYFIS